MEKPVKCGCGGEAYVNDDGGAYSPCCYRVECPRCMIVTPFYATKEKAVAAWNRAMGERTAKVKQYGNKIYIDEYSVGQCGNCGAHLLESSIYCQDCGARLEWDDAE